MHEAHCFDVRFCRQGPATDVLTANLVKFAMDIFKGVVQRGHGVASGRSSQSPYPAGTIKMQEPLLPSKEEVERVQEALQKSQEEREAAWDQICDLLKNQHLSDMTSNLLE